VIDVLIPLKLVPTANSVTGASIVASMAAPGADEAFSTLREVSALPLLSIVEIAEP